MGKGQEAQGAHDAQDPLRGLKTQLYLGVSIQKKIEAGNKGNDDEFKCNNEGEKNKILQQKRKIQ